MALDQGQSGLGLEAQRESVLRYVEKVAGKLVAEFSEVKRGLKTGRPELAEALRVCRMRRAILVIARLDRLARNVTLIADLMDSELEFVAVDFPHASRLTLHVLAAIAEYESRLMSERTKAAMAAAKARGIVFTRPGQSFKDLRAALAASVETNKAKAAARARDLAPLVRPLFDEGKLPVEIAAELNKRHILTPRQHAWSAAGVRRLLRLIGAVELHASVAASRLDWRTARAYERWTGLAPLIWGLRRDGLSMASIADEMNRQRIPTPRGAPWQSSVICRILHATAHLVGETQGIGAVRSVLRWAKARQRALDLAPSIVAARAQGRTLDEIASALNGQGLRAPRGGPWTRGAVRQMLAIAAKEQSASNPRADRALFRAPPRDQVERVMAVAPDVWRLRALGKSTSAIAEELHREQVAPRKHKHWRRSTVERVLNLTAHRFPDEVKAIEGAPNPWVVRARERAAEVEPLLRELRATMTYTATATELTRRGVKTPGGNRRWTYAMVRRTLARAEEWSGSPRMAA